MSALDDRERLIGLEAQATAEARMLANQLGIAHLRIQALEAQNRQLQNALRKIQIIAHAADDKDCEELADAALAATELKP